MNKIAVIILVIILGIAVISVVTNGSKKSNTPPEISQTTPAPASPTEAIIKAGPNPLNTTYVIEGQSITLVNGKAVTEAAPGSATKITTSYFGNEAKEDLNGDGLSDVAFLLTQNTGGSGTFFYVVASLQNSNGTYSGTNGVLLGDRISPQTTTIQKEIINVNYATRGPDQAMTEQPSFAVSKYFDVSGHILKEIAGDSTGNNP